MIHSKKGLSEIVTSILIILIAVAAVVVIWQVLLPLIRTPGEKAGTIADCTANPITIDTISCPVGQPTATITISVLGTDTVQNIRLSASRTGTAATSMNPPSGTATVRLFTATWGTNNAATDSVIATGTYEVISGGATTTCNTPTSRPTRCS